MPKTSARTPDRSCQLAFTPQQTVPARAPLALAARKVGPCDDTRKTPAGSNGARLVKQVKQAEKVRCRITAVPSSGAGAGAGARARPESKNAQQHDHQTGALLRALADTERELERVLGTDPARRNLVSTFVSALANEPALTDMTRMLLLHAARKRALLGGQGPRDPEHENQLFAIAIHARSLAAEM